MTPERAKRVCEAAASWNYAKWEIDFFERVLEGRPERTKAVIRKGSDLIDLGENGIRSLRIPGLWDSITKAIETKLAECRQRMESLELKEEE